MSKEQVRFTLRMPEDLHEYLKQRSEELGVSINGLIRIALEKYVREERFMNSDLPALLKLAKEHNVPIELPTDLEGFLSTTKQKDM